MKLVFFALCLLLGASTAHADRKIYSCKDANGGTVFSSAPCGTDAKELNYDAGRVSAPLPVGSIAPTAPGPQVNDAVRDISDGVADADCRRSAQNNAVYPDDRYIRELERRKSNVESQGTNANNNIAGATYLNGIREQIGQMDIAIAQERTRISTESGRIDANYRLAIEGCDKAKTAREQARAQH